MKADFETVLPFVVLYLATFWCLWTFGDWMLLGLSVALAPWLIWISVRDMRLFEIPDVATMIVALVGTAYVWHSETQALATHLGTGLLVMCFFWVIGDLYFRYSGQEGLGIGDAKLFGAGAVLLGPSKLPELILFSSLGGILGYLISALFSQDNNQGIPFGPFVAYSIFILSFLDRIFV